MSIFGLSGHNLGLAIIWRVCILCFWPFFLGKALKSMDFVTARIRIENSNVFDLFDLQFF